MISHKKEKLWRIASDNFTLFSEGQMQHAVIRDMWDEILNVIADQREMPGDPEKTYEALKKAASFSEVFDVQMVKFWMDQFFFYFHTEFTRECCKKAVLDLHKYKLEHRNPLTTASGEIRVRYIDKPRIIYVR